MFHEGYRGNAEFYMDPMNYPDFIMDFYKKEGLKYRFNENEIIELIDTTKELKEVPSCFDEFMENNNLKECFFYPFDAIAIFDKTYLILFVKKWWIKLLQVDTA